MASNSLPSRWSLFNHKEMDFKVDKSLYSKQFNSVKCGRNLCRHIKDHFKGLADLSYVLHGFIILLVWVRQGQIQGGARGVPPLPSSTSIISSKRSKYSNRAVTYPNTEQSPTHTEFVIVFILKFK